MRVILISFDMVIFNSTVIFPCLMIGLGLPNCYQVEYVNDKYNRYRPI